MTHTENLNKLVESRMGKQTTKDEWVVSLLTSIAYSLATIADLMLEKEDKKESEE